MSNDIAFEDTAVAVELDIQEFKNLPRRKDGNFTATTGWQAAAIIARRYNADEIPTPEPGSLAYIRFSDADLANRVFPETVEDRRKPDHTRKRMRTLYRDRIAAMFAAWQRAAEEGLTQNAADLAPGVEVCVPDHKTVKWAEFYRAGSTLTPEMNRRRKAWLEQQERELAERKAQEAAREAAIPPEEKARMREEKNLKSISEWANSHAIMESTLPPDAERDVWLAIHDRATRIQEELEGIRNLAAKLDGGKVSFFDVSVKGISGATARLAGDALSNVPNEAAEISEFFRRSRIPDEARYREFAVAELAGYREIGRRRRDEEMRPENFM